MRQVDWGEFLGGGGKSCIVLADEDRDIFAVVGDLSSISARVVNSHLDSFVEFDLRAVRYPNTTNRIVDVELAPDMRGSTPSKIATDEIAFAKQPSFARPRVGEVLDQTSPRRRQP